MSRTAAGWGKSGRASDARELPPVRQAARRQSPGRAGDLSRYRGWRSAQGGGSAKCRADGGCAPGMSGPGAGDCPLIVIGACPLIVCPAGAVGLDMSFSSVRDGNRGAAGNAAGPVKAGICTHDSRPEGGSTGDLQRCCPAPTNGAVAATVSLAGLRACAPPGLADPAPCAAPLQIGRAAGVSQSQDLGFRPAIRHGKDMDLVEQGLGAASDLLPQIGGISKSSRQILPQATQSRRRRMADCPYTASICATSASGAEEFGTSLQSSANR